VKKVANSKYSLSCHLFDACVVCNGGYYILVSEMLKNWKFSKVSIHYHCRGQQSVHWAAYSLQKVLPTDRKIRRVSKKSQISTEKITKTIMSVWKEKLYKPWKFAFKMLFKLVRYTGIGNIEKLTQSPGACFSKVPKSHLWNYQLLALESQSFNMF